VLERRSWMGWPGVLGFCCEKIDPARRLASPSVADSLPPLLFLPSGREMYLRSQSRQIPEE
jgi:hypothetical protein